MTPEEIEKLQKWIEFYLQTLPDNAEGGGDYEIIDTDRGFADTELTKFIQFLRQHNG